MVFRQSESIQVKRVKGKGRGVFARRFIAKGEIIERVPVLILSAREFDEHVSRTILDDYCFLWEGGKIALTLGYGSLYNHSYQPNARSDIVDAHTQLFTAIRSIDRAEEITVNYNGAPRSQRAVWFEPFAGSLSSRRNRATRS